MPENEEPVVEEPKADEPVVEPSAIALGSPITKADITAKFNTTVADVQYGATYWYAGGPNIPGYFPTAELAPRIVDKATVAQFGPAIVASQIATVMGNYVKLYSSVRNTRFIRTYNYYYGDVVDYDQTYVGSLVAAHKQPSLDSAVNAVAPANKIVAGEVIKTTTFNSYVQGLYDRWVISKNNTITFTAWYCHTPAPPSCHSRGRR